MKRIALLLVCGALVGSAQEVRISRAAVLKAERTIVSLRAGTIVDVISRDEWTLTVRFNNHTGLIPASSLTPGAMSTQTESGFFGASAKKSVGSASKAQETGSDSSQSGAKKSPTILAAN